MIVDTQRVALITEIQDQLNEKYEACGIELVDVMGDDLRVANAARVSMKKRHISFEGSDEKLIKFLAESDPPHFTPFTHCMITFQLKMPIYVARQWFRHTVGFTRNEVSRRYVDDAPEVWFPEELRKRPEGSIKQGSGEPLDEEVQAKLGWVLEVSGQKATEGYDYLLKRGVAPEQARTILPLATVTEFYETASLYAYARLCNERLDSHAQQEIRGYAEGVNQVLRELFPVSWGALMDAGLSRRHRLQRQAILAAWDYLADDSPDRFANMSIAEIIDKIMETIQN